MIQQWNGLLQRILKWIAIALLKLTKRQAFFVLLAVALIVSLILVLSIDFLWDGRFSSEMIFAGVVVPILDGALIVGLLSAFLGELREETERSKKAQEEIKFKNTILQTLQETPLDGILVVDENVKIISYNQQFVELWGSTLEMENSSLDASMLESIAQQVKDQEAFIARIHNMYAHRDMKSREEILLKDGRVIDQYFAPITGADGRYYGRVRYCRDITDSKRAEEQIRNFAFFDALTQLPNRRLLNDRLKMIMASGRRSGLYSAVVFVDLDNFKSLNDTHGHDIGDLLLIEAAQRITGCVREMDTVARFGVPLHWQTKSPKRSAPLWKIPISWCTNIMERARLRWNISAHRVSAWWSSLTMKVPWMISSGWPIKRCIKPKKMGVIPSVYMNSSLTVCFYSDEDDLNTV